MVDFRTKGIRVEDDMHINQLVISLFMSEGAPSCGGCDLLGEKKEKMLHTLTADPKKRILITKMR